MPTFFFVKRRINGLPRKNGRIVEVGLGLNTAAPKRAEAAKANAGYHQLQAADADHFFDGQDEVLVTIFGGWLDEVVPAGD